MAVQHSAIPDNQRHEPKGISTAANRTVYISNGAASGVWRRANELDMDYSVKANNRFGWNDIADSLYTSGSPRAISTGVRTQLTNNATASQTDVTRLGGIWNTSTNVFLINDLNAVYVFNLKMKVQTSSAASSPYTLNVEFESANGPTIIAGHTQYLKGGNHVNWVNFSVPIYVGSFINNQNLSLFVTPDTNVNVYDIGYVVQRNYLET